MWSRPDEARARLQAELDRILEVLAATDGVEEVWVFGSLVEGQPGATSDLDLLVVRRTDEPVPQRGVTLARMLAPRAAVDLFVYTPDEVAASGRFVAGVRARGRRVL